MSFIQLFLMFDKKKKVKCFFVPKNIHLCTVFQDQKMSYLRSTTSVLRKFILIGWAVAVVWIYMGNLVNFHQNRIWGKQLIPVACSSTRSKEKDVASVVKYDRNLKLFVTGHQFDFTTPDQHIVAASFHEIITVLSFLPDTPVLRQGIQAFSFRGPPSA
jgi:hypothetical protein